MRYNSTIWHPCSQMKDYESFEPLQVVSAKGTYLQLENGKKIIDAISSWWCKSLGHNHPRLKAALIKQAETFEHVILANTTNNTIERLAEKLTSFHNDLGHVFFGGDGSTAVEIALKMAIHAMQLLGEPHRREFLALQNGYHGETALTLAVSDLGIYKAAYKDLAPEYTMIDHIPYVSGKNDPLWHDCSAVWPIIEQQLDIHKETLCGIVFEPVVQGAGGMLFYSPDFLRRLRSWATQHGVYLIADEIMTGFYRTGSKFAVDHAGIVPDFLCMSKGLTGGWMAMSAVLINNSLYELFYDDYDAGKNFLHSNTYAGNALAAAVACEALNIYEEMNMGAVVSQLESEMNERLEHVLNKTEMLHNVRVLGGVAAADILTQYTEKHPRLGYDVYRKAVSLGALLRPLGNTVYWFPPLNIDMDDLDLLTSITTDSLQAFKK